MAGNGVVTITTNTQTPFSTSYFCLEVPDQDAPTNLHYSLPFPVSVSSCSDKITFTDPTTTSFTLEVPTSDSGTTSTVLTGSSHFATSNPTNCPISLTLHLASDDSAYSGLFLTLESDGTLKVDTNVIGSATVYIKMVSGNGALTYQTSNLAISTACTAAYTITIGSATTLQYGALNDAAAGFTLPSISSSHATCPATIAITSSSNSMVSVSSSLADPVDVNGNKVVKAVDTSVHQ
jgi:hypothetical protein